MVKKTQTTTKKKARKGIPAKSRSKFLIPLYNQRGEVIKNIGLPEAIFGQKPNPSLISQAVRVYSSKRKLSATKTRSQVAGGGRKPHRQKGTGRARAGSIRAPGRVGGGVVFGPTPVEANLKLTKKLRQRALATALSSKLTDNAIILVSEISLKEPKTKKALEIIKKIGASDKRTILLVLKGKNPAVVKSFRNLKEVNITRALDLNTLNVLKSSGLILTLEALEQLKGRFGERHGKSD